MTYFLAGIFGGLGVGIVLGFILGARAQRQLGLIFKLEAAKARQREEAAPEYYDEIIMKGTEHPVGPVPPRPGEVAALRRQARNPLGWMKNSLKRN